MFELQRLQGGGEEGIALQTRKGQDISNSLGADLTEQHDRCYRAILDRHGQNWLLRRPPHGGYNCAGHVWASRRTCIYEEEAWRMILLDDGFRETDTPVPDDLAIYVDKVQGILHIARVVELREGVTPESRRIPWVVSKWGLAGGEACHSVYDHPCSIEDGFLVAIEYMTDRPAF